MTSNKSPGVIVPIHPAKFVDKGGTVWEPRTYDLDTLDSVREMIADALHSRTIGVIDQALFKDIMSAAQTAIKALSTVQTGTVAEGILHSLAARQPAEHPERGAQGPGAEAGEAQIC